MNNQRREKALKIFELATILNDTSTQQKLTKNKPTVFVEFRGHLCILVVWIYSNGWLPTTDCDFSYYIYLSDELKTTDRELDECLVKLTEFCEKWKAKEEKINE